MYVGTVATLKACIGALAKQGYEYADPKLFKSKKGQPPALIPPKLRYFAYHAGEMTVNGTKIKTTPEELKQVLDGFKSKNNKQGQIIKLFIGTTYEGLDMSFLQAVHITSPLPTLEDDAQAVGRALRYCGHDPAANQVKVYRYFATPPRQLNHGNLTDAKRKKVEEGVQKLHELNTGGVNMHVFRDAARRGKPLEAFMSCVQGQSIECDASSAPGGILGSVQFKPVQCRAQCNVALDNKGELVIPKHKPPHDAGHAGGHIRGQKGHISGQKGHVSGRTSRRPGPQQPTRAIPSRANPPSRPPRRLSPSVPPPRQTRSSPQPPVSRPGSVRRGPVQAANLEDQRRRLRQHQKIQMTFERQRR